MDQFFAQAPNATQFIYLESVNSQQILVSVRRRQAQIIEPAGGLNGVDLSEFANDALHLYDTDFRISNADNGVVPSGAEVDTLTNE